MSIEIRDITEADLMSVFALMIEFAAFEKLSKYLDLKPENYRSAMFGQNAFVKGLIASSDGVPVGYAVYYPCFATFRSLPGLFLEDLFVSERARGIGIGDLLLKEVARRARLSGFERIDLHVLDWNAQAIEFYKKSAELIAIMMTGISGSLMPLSQNWPNKLDHQIVTNPS